MKPKILFLYTELAPYITQCFEAIEWAQVYVIHYPVNQEAPFSEEKKDGVVYKEITPKIKSEVLKEWVDEISPNLIFCSGWIDKRYLSVKKSFKTPFIMCFDTPYKAKFKQGLKTLWFKLFYKKGISAIWVPGSQQKKLGSLMGFKNHQIFTGFYVAKDNHPLDLKFSKPLKLFYLGRYVAQKNVSNLWKAIERVNKNELRVELHAYGTGDLWEEAPKDVLGLYHHGFLNYKDFHTTLNAYHFNILPSLYEPWGVGLQDVLHLGFPVLCSSKVLAAEAFNGMHLKMLEDLSAEGLADGITSVLSLNDMEFQNLSRSAAKSAKQLSLNDWLLTFEKIYHTFVL